MADVNSSVMPLYDRVKNQIYDDFQRLSRQESIVFSAKGRSNYVRALKHYRIKYNRFVTNIFSTNLYKKIKEQDREILENYRANANLIKTREQITTITMLCASIIRDMNITKISFDRSDEIF